ncbi:carbamoyltransferase C-terminal domain-containing protein [Micromonospora sp. NPDC047793]|uniref:carbamoyltransferase C-terminal domain-containing protein n=1 Tax=Micromonospora sp. NPDC047793 TaxID=3154342 RepID=UPI0033ED7B01
MVWDTDAAALAYAVDADGRYARIDAEPFDTVPELGDRLRTAGDGGPMNLCLTGDRALDVTLSSAIRTLPEVKALWVPPFPDVTGDAAGAAALHLAHCRTRAATDAGDPADPVLPGLAWRLRSGTVPARPVHAPAGWTVSPCRPEELARMLVRGGRPVVFINGPAKLGPYALGSRSILAPATSGDARARLGALRGDPTGTTVTALCLERDVPDVFAPGIPDPYVRFEHRLRDEWADRLPGLADGGPGPLRVQTVSMDDDPTLSTVVREYHKWSGIPALCATDAVPADTGPLADVAAALSWGGLDLVWSDNILYRANRQEPPR